MDQIVFSSAQGRIRQVSWSKLVGEVVSATEWTALGREDLVAAARADLANSLRPVFSQTLAHLSGLATSLVPNPLERHSLQRRVRGDVFFLADCLSLEEDRIRSVISRFALPRITAYRNLLLAIQGLEAVVGKLSIVAVDSLGDPHDHGAAVCRIRSGDGKSYIYKPRSARVEMACAEVEKTVLGDFSLVSTPLVDGADHSWWVEIEELSGPVLETSAEALGSAVGRALVLSSLLAWDDLHHENVLFTGARGLVSMVDTETVWAAQIPVDRTALGFVPPLAWLASRSLLLPQPAVNGDRFADDSALGKLLLKRKQDDRDSWELAGQSAWMNCTDLVQKSPEWFMQFSSGLKASVSKAAERILAIDSESLIRALGLPSFRTRYVYRPTRTYVGMIRKAILLEVVSGVPLEETLWQLLFRATSEGAVKAELHAVVSARECSQMALGLVPIFWTNADGELETTDGKVLGVCRSDLLAKGAHLEFAKTAQAWDEVAFTAAQQVGLLAHLSNPRPSAVSHKDAAVSGRELDPVKRLAIEFGARALVGAQGQACFLDFVPSGSASEFSTRWTGPGLYRGSAGIGLAWWAVHKFFPLAPHAELWRACFAAGRSCVERRSFEELSRYGWSLCDGVFGVAYAMSVTSGSSSEVDAVLSSLEASFSESSLAEWADWDLIGGWSGAVACYSAVLARSSRAVLSSSGKAFLKRAISVIGDQLLAEQLPRQKGQRGLAHGVGGALYALGRAARYWPDTTMLQCIDGLRSQFISQLILEGHEDWNNAGTWCGGATGIVRAFRRIPEFAPDLPEWFLRSCNSETASLEQVCCGSLGRLMHASETIGSLGSPLDVSIGASLLQRAAEDDFVSFEAFGRSLRTLGFFQGVSGSIYYGCHAIAGARCVAIEMVD